MRWYEGGIATAVQESKKSGAVFVVYIEGKDDKSVALTDLINNEEISSKLASEHFIAIKLEANSIPHQQFSQIYKVAVVPSIFFIGKTGTPLEIITEPLSLSDFAAKLQVVLEKHGIKSNAESSTNLIEQEKTGPNQNVVCENGVCRLVDKASTSKESDAQNEELSKEEKLERAKELIELKREAKEQEEKEKEKSKEIERRKMGQDVQKLKRWQEDQQLKNIMEEREREKREEQAARQRILAQIEQDKADRAARFGTTSQAPSQPKTSPQPEKRGTVDSNTARLQFKLPDGSSHTQNFPSGECLQTVRNYIRSNLNLPFSNYVLSTAFPRREFTSNDNAETLADLGLVPNAVVLILPVSQGTVVSRPGGGLGGLFWTLITPFLNVLGYLRLFIFGSSTTAQQNNRDSAKRPADSNAEASTSRSQPKRRMGESTVVRRQGNIHRLSDKTDSDDDNNTWNGNSTQQM